MGVGSCGVWHIVFESNDMENGGIFFIFPTKSFKGYKVISGKIDNRSLYITEFETWVPNILLYLTVGVSQFYLRLFRKC